MDFNTDSVQLFHQSLTNQMKPLRKMWNKISSQYLNKKWTKVGYILRARSEGLFNESFLSKYKHIKEIEHQVGRYLNMERIFKDLNVGGEKFIRGDIVEFGTWQGLGLIYFSWLLGMNRENRRLIGIDSFQGLPHDSTIWRKGTFSNTGTDLVLANFKKYADQRFKREFLSLIKGWFNESEVKNQLNKQVTNIALVHFDADLGTSTTQALALIEPYLVNRKEPIYFLFDDWGCHPDEVPDAFLAWIEQFNKVTPLTVMKIYSTRFTRYYKINFV